MKKKIERIKELFSKLPEWAQLIVGFILFVTLIVLWFIIWDFIRPFTMKWLLYPLGYIILLIIYGGITLFSGFHLVKHIFSVLRSIPTKFGEVKFKKVPGLCVYLFMYMFWVLCRSPRLYFWL